MPSARRWLLAALTLPLVVPASASALGLEIMPAGGRPAGRGGAVVAGADSPWALFHNPALLARVRGNQLVVAGHLHLAQRCMTRVEVIETDDGREPGETYPEVCTRSVAPVPQLAGSFELAEGLTLGVGLWAPPGDMRKMTYGDRDSLTIEHEGMQVPTPTRYLLVDADLIAVYPTVGIGYEPHPAFRFGAAFGWGVARIGFVSAAFARLNLGTQPLDRDGRVHVRARDNFQPRVTLGVHSQPAQEIPFEMGLAYIWQDDLRTRNARLDMAVDVFAGSRVEDTVHGVDILIPLPSQLTFGMRYFSPLAAPVGTAGDRLSTERFDLELNVAVSFGNRVDAFVATLPEGAALCLPPDCAASVSLPGEFRLEHQWRTQVAVRLGGDINPIPDRLGLRWGLSFESHGVQPGYEQIDFLPFRRYGFHLGATVRVHRAVDLSIAYAHVLQPNRHVGVDSAQLRRPIGGDTTPEDAIVINAGTIRTTFNAVVLELASHF
jgi:hypothetical protein